MRAARRAWFMLIPALLLTCLGTAKADPPYADQAAPVYAILSVTDGFSISLEQEGEIFYGSGSPVILVPLGVFQGGTTVQRSRFFREAPAAIPLPGDTLFLDLSGNQVTIVGSFETTFGTPTAHMVTPTPTSILGDVQRAFYDATRNGALDALVSDAESSEPTFPTTWDIVAAIDEYMDTDSTATLQDIYDAVFTSPMVLDEISGTSSVTLAAEDDLFPHEDNSESIFIGSISLDEDLNFATDVCTLVGVEVLQDKINLKKKGKLPVAIYTTDDFDAAEIDGSTLQLGGVFAVHWALEDLDDDGDDDLVCHFEVPELVDADVLTSSTTSVTLTAELESGACILGTSSVDVN